ncbi:MAG: hypothetical protein AAFR27_07030, partial [Pseudomonadota bacterium]
DAVVRVQAGRLRDQLATYYDTEGSGNAIKISVPRGTYVPVYERSSSTDEVEPGETLDFEHPETGKQPIITKPDRVRIEPNQPVSPFIVANVRRFWIALISIVILLLVILFILWRMPGGSN